jgi:hypothetical protein
MIVAATGPLTGVYRLFLFLHIASAIIGFGAVVLNGVYAAQIRKRPPNEAAAIAEANTAVTKVGEYFIYAVFVFGLIVAILGTKDKVHYYDFSDLWLSISMALYVVGIGVSHAVMIPTGRRINEVLRAGGGPEMETLGRKAALGGTFLNLLLVVILLLMVFKPGSPRF